MAIREDMICKRCGSVLSAVTFTCVRRADCLNNTYDLYWSPEGRKIATVRARTAHTAIALAPLPYRKFRGEIYAVEVTA